MNFRVGGVMKNHSHKRSSKVAYLTDSKSKISNKISRRIETATHFNVANFGNETNSEDLQVLKHDTFNMES